MASARELWVEEPPSEQIAETLNDTSANYCEHGRDPCYLRCGVRKRGRWWEPIPTQERQRWARNTLD